MLVTTAQLFKAACGKFAREHFRDNPADFDFRKPGKAFIAAYAASITDKSKYLGCYGQLETVRTALTEK